MRGRKQALERSAQLGAKIQDPPETPKLVPLKCPVCSAPVPLGAGDAATCAFCQTVVLLPAEYRTLRDTEQQRTTDRDHATKLYEQLGTPPSAALRAWATFATFATGTLFGVVVIFLTIFSTLLLVMGFALEIVVHALAGPFGIDLIDRFGGGTVYAAFVAILVLGALLPMWATSYFDSLAQIKHTLQVNLAAIPPEKPGFPSTCRGCGAALDVPTGAYGVLCPYCQADNIVSLPPEWLAVAGVKQATFHKSIVTAVGLADAIRQDARKMLPSAAKWSVGVFVVFGLMGRACSAMDRDGSHAIGTFKDSYGPPRQMESYWEPGVREPIGRMVPFKHLPYTVALRHRETLIWSSNDEGWGGEIRINNTSTFPFTAKHWTRPWLQRKDGTYAATFTAPYTGLFVVELHSNEPREGGTHLRWLIGKEPAPGRPARPALTTTDVTPVAPVPPPPIADAVVEKQLELNEPIVARAISPNGHDVVTAAKSGIVHGVIEKKAIDSGSSGVMPDSAGATALVFLTDTIFASGDANGVIKVWDCVAGIELYDLPQLLSIASLSADGLSLTASYPGGAKKFTVAKSWRQ